MDPKAKGEFLKKISMNGFSMEEKENLLMLQPRGAEGTAEVVIAEVELDIWRVVGASGAYRGFARGAKRAYFESYITRWVAEAILQAGGQLIASPQAHE